MYIVIEYDKDDEFEKRTKNVLGPYLRLSVVIKDSFDIKEDCRGTITFWDKNVRDKESDFFKIIWAINAQNERETLIIGPSANVELREELGSYKYMWL
jgi:hypothetical protein